MARLFEFERFRTDADLKRVVAGYAVKCPREAFDAECANGEWIGAKWLDAFHGYALGNLEALRSAFRGGNFAAMRWMSERCPGGVVGLSGDMRVLRWARRNRNNDFMLYMIRKKGMDTNFSPKTLRWFLRVGKPSHQHAKWLANAVSGGDKNEYHGPYRHLLLAEIVEWIAQAGGDITRYTLCAIEHAIYKGDLNSVKRLSKLDHVRGGLQFTTPNPDNRIAPFAESNVACLEWVHRKYGITPIVLRKVARGAPEDVSEWASSKLV